MGKTQGRTLLVGMFMLMSVSTLAGVAFAEEAEEKGAEISSLPVRNVEEIRKEWEQFAPFLRENNLDQFDFTNVADLKELVKQRLHKEVPYLHLKILNSVIKNLGNEGSDFNEAMKNFISIHKNRKVSSKVFQDKLSDSLKALKERHNFENTEARKDSALDEFVKSFGEMVGSHLD